MNLGKLVLYVDGNENEHLAIVTKVVNEDNEITVVNLFVYALDGNFSNVNNVSSKWCWKDIPV